MRRELWVIAVAVAVLCIGGAAIWWLGSQPASERATTEIGVPGTTLDEEDIPVVVEPTEQDTAKELDETLDDYLGGVRQAYGSESQAYLDDGSPKVEIPVPPVDAVDREVPRLALPAPDEPAKRP